MASIIKNKTIQVRDLKSRLFKINLQVSILYFGKLSDLVVTIRIRLGRDGAVQSADILDANYAEDANFRTMAESARRAVLRASPIKALRLFGDDYNQWRDVTMTFRPPV